MTTVKPSYKKQMATWDFYDEKILNAIQDFLPQGEEPTVATIQKHLLSMHGPKISRQTIYEHLKKHPEYFPKKGKRGVFVNAEYEMVDKLRNDLPEELKYGYVETLTSPKLDYNEMLQLTNTNPLVKMWSEERNKLEKRMLIPFVGPLFYQKWSRTSKLEEQFKREAFDMVVRDAEFIARSTKIRAFSTKPLEKLSSWNYELLDLVAKMIMVLKGSQDFSVEDYRCAIFITFDPLQTYIDLLESDISKLIEEVAQDIDIKTYDLDPEKKEKFKKMKIEHYQKELENLLCESYRLSCKKMKTFSKVTFEKYKKSTPKIIETRIDNQLKELQEVREKVRKQTIGRLM